MLHIVSIKRTLQIILTIFVEWLNTWSFIYTILRFSTWIMKLVNTKQKSTNVVSVVVLSSHEGNLCDVVRVYRLLPRLMTLFAGCWYVLLFMFCNLDSNLIWLACLHIHIVFEQSNEFQKKARETFLFIAFNVWVYELNNIFTYFNLQYREFLLSSSIVQLYQILTIIVHNRYALFRNSKRSKQH